MIEVNIKDIMNLFEKKLEEKYEKSWSSIKEILYRIFNFLYDIIIVLKEFLKNISSNSENSSLIINNCIHKCLSFFDLSPKYYKHNELENFVNNNNNLIKDLKNNIHPLNHLEVTCSLYAFNNKLMNIESHVNNIINLFNELKKQIKNNETILIYINSIHCKFSKLVKICIKEMHNLEYTLNINEYYQLFIENILPIKNELNFLKTKSLVVKMTYLLKENYLSKVQMNIIIKEIIKYYDIIIIMNLEQEINEEQLKEYLSILKMMKSSSFIDKYLLKINQNILINTVNFIIDINIKIVNIIKIEKDFSDEKKFLNYYSIFKITTEKIKEMQKDDNYNQEFKEYSKEKNNNLLIKYLDKTLEYKKKLWAYDNFNYLLKFLREQFQTIFYNEFQERLVLLV